MRYLFGLAAFGILIPIFALTGLAIGAYQDSRENGVITIFQLQVYNTLGVWIVAFAALSAAAAAITVVERGVVTRPSSDTSAQPQRAMNRHEPMPAGAIIAGIIVAIAFVAWLVTAVVDSHK